MGKKMDTEKRAKLIFSGEYIVIALIFLVLGILKLINVFNLNNSHTLFNWLTIFGGSWITIDFFWAIFSSKRRNRVCILDKCLSLPAGIFLIVFDIISFMGKSSDELWRYGVGGLFVYIGVIYMFQGFYHYKHPTPELLRALEEDNKEENKEASIKENVIADETISNKDEENSDQ